MINVNGAGMVGAPGSYAKVFDVLGQEQHQHHDDFHRRLRSQHLHGYSHEASWAEPSAHLEIALTGQRGLVSEVTAEDDVAVVAVMGANMKGTRGVASKIFSTVANAGINIRMIAQGSSELNISFVVKEKDGAAVVRAIHEEFQLDKNLARILPTSSLQQNSQNS